MGTGTVTSNDDPTKTSHRQIEVDISLERDGTYKLRHQRGNAVKTVYETPVFKRDKTVTLGCTTITVEALSALLYDAFAYEDSE